MIFKRWQSFSGEMDAHGIVLLLALIVLCTPPFILLVLLLLLLRSFFVCASSFDRACFRDTHKRGDLMDGQTHSRVCLTTDDDYPPTGYLLFDSSTCNKT